MDSIESRKVRKLITEQLIKGIRSKDITALVSKKYGIKQRMSEIHLAKVKKGFIKQMDAEQPYYLAHALEVKRDLFSKAYDKDDIKLANEISNDDNKLKGLLIDKVIHETTQPLAIQINVNTPQAANSKIIELDKD